MFHDLMFYLSGLKSFLGQVSVWPITPVFFHSVLLGAAYHPCCLACFTILPALSIQFLNHCQLYLNWIAIALWYWAFWIYLNESFAFWALAFSLGCLYSHFWSCC